MNFSQFKIDTTLNIESIIAALAILGAAIGFLLNLIKNWKRDYKEKRYRGTNHIILDLLELNFKDGMSEDKLWSQYCSSETQSKRNSFAAYKPTKLKRLGFENQLKHLQSRFLIRLTGPAHYHIDFREPRDWKDFYRKTQYSKILNQIKNEFGEKEIKDILVKSIEANGLSSYSTRDTYKYLFENGDDLVVTKFVEALRSDNDEIRKNAIELFIELTREFG